jgi:molybdopterin-guanine dinucleotide biosynthesis protein A
MFKIGAVILAGGKNSRMGENKAYLTLAGETFLARMTGQLSQFEELLISADNAGKYAEAGLAVVEDLHPECGPIGGIYSALCACRSDYLLVVSCDMPLFKKELAQYLTEFVSDSYDALVLSTRDGQIEPLCAIYAKHIKDIFKTQIEAGNYSMRGVLDKVRVCRVPIFDTDFPDEVVKNVNTPQEYQQLVGEK